MTMLSVVGIPLDANSSFMKGAASAPAKIRQALRSDSANMFTESGLDLGDSQLWKDEGDIQLDSIPSAFDNIRNKVSDLLKNNHGVISLGGDHSISYPVVQAFAERHGPLDILHLDAHSDLYDNFEGNRFSHACPFARIMENGLANRLVQVGIRTLNQHQREQAKRFGVEVYEMKSWSDDIRFSFGGPLYISMDLDALDPAFVPGVSHHEPGGFTTRQVINIIQKAQGNVVGADIVELNPTRDINDVTAMVAAKLLKELAAKIISG